MTDITQMASTGGVVVTGAASGVGLAIVRQLLQRGARVVGIDRVPVGQLPPEFPEITARCSYSQADVAISGTVRSCVDSQNADVEALVLCAAEGPFCSDPHRIVKTNFVAAVENILSLVERMGEWCSVLLFSSTAAYRHDWEQSWNRLLEEPFGGPRIASLWERIAALDGQSAYGLSKWALNRATNRLARELAPRRVRVNCLSLGPTKTPMSAPLWTDDPPAWDRLTTESPFCRANSPEDVAKLAAFLMEPSAQMVHGSTLHVDGGWHAAHACRE